MNRYTRDYHGWNVVAAVRDVEHLLYIDLNHLRDNEDVYIELITGHGKIREEIASFLDRHNCVWDYQLGNMGCIIIRRIYA